MNLPRFRLSEKYPIVKWTLLILPLLLLLPLVVADIQPPAAARCAAVLLLMAVYWTGEVLPLPITSLLPVILFPLLGVISTNDIAPIYMKGTQMFYMGSLMIALAVEESGLHKRLALRALMLSGDAITSIMLGFMCVTAFLSMWISNAATTAMMMPILEAVLKELNVENNEGRMMYLSIAYSASVGGLCTIIGNPPNLILNEFMNQQFTEEQPLNFSSWMLFSLPGGFINLFILWIVLQLYFLRPSMKEFFGQCKAKTKENNTRRFKDMIKERYEALGPVTFHEIATLCLFCLIVIIWFFRKPGFMPGWTTLFNWEGDISIATATPTLLIVVLFFIIPADYKNPKGRTLLVWKNVQTKFPWGVLLLMGGGFALAKGANESCLSQVLSLQLAGLKSLDPSMVLFIVCIISSALSQVASNSTIVTIMVPVVFVLSETLGTNPLYLALGVTITASYAFMLPVGTPYNAIVYDAGKNGADLKVLHMSGVGLILGGLFLLTTLLSLHTWTGDIISQK